MPLEHLEGVDRDNLEAMFGSDAFDAGRAFHEGEGLRFREGNEVFVDELDAGEVGSCCRGEFPGDGMGGVLA